MCVPEGIGEGVFGSTGDVSGTWLIGAGVVGANAVGANDVIPMLMMGR